MKAQSSTKSRSRSSQHVTEVLQLGLIKLLGVEDGFEYCIQYEGGKDTGETPFLLAQEQSVFYDHYGQLRLGEENYVLFQVLQRSPGTGDAEGLFPRWIRVDLPPPSVAWRSSTVRLGSGLSLALRVMTDAVAMTDRSYSEVTYEESVQTLEPFVLPPPPEPLVVAEPFSLNAFERRIKESPEYALEIFRKFMATFKGFGMDSSGKDEMDFDRFYIDLFDKEKVDPIEAMECFQAIDKDGSGTLSRMEVMRFLYHAVTKFHDRQTVFKVKSCMCFLMFASQPAHLPKTHKAVLTVEDLVPGLGV
eukprot:EG_transcript_10303